MKLKYKDIPRVKKEITYIQDGLCAICKRQLDMLKNRDICLDHNHKTGRIRGVLCRSCNAIEGKVRKLYIRMGLRKAGIPYEDLLCGLFNYCYIDELDIIHPKFKEKKVEK